LKRFILLCTIYYQAVIHGFDPGIITAQCFVESSFNQYAQNKQCCGLMQVSLPVWRKELNIDEGRLFEANYNLLIGLSILRHYMNVSNGDIWRALHLYNNGFKHNNLKYVKKIKKAIKLFYGENIK
jgi:soluble lytic murein transglycosylase-like protein